MKTKLTCLVVFGLAAAAGVPSIAQKSGVPAVPPVPQIRTAPVPPSPPAFDAIGERMERLLRMMQDRRLLGDYSSEKFSLSFAGKPGMTIVLDHQFGDIDVRKGSNSRVKIDGEKRVSARDKDREKEFLKEMGLKVDEQENRLKVAAYYPEERRVLRGDKRNVRNFSISYTIEIPENVTLEIENSFGNVDLTELDGDFTVRNGFGSLTAKGLKGRTDLRNQFGKINAENIEGDAEISNENGTLWVTSVRGSVDARGQFGEIRVEDITGNAEVSGGHGRMEVSRITGDAILSNTFGSINCVNVGGAVDIRNNNAKVDVEDAGKDVTISTSFGKVSAVDVKGALFVRNNNASVYAESIAGNVEVINTFGPVEIMTAGGDVAVRNRNGSVTVGGILHDAQEPRTLKLETSFANINLTLPGDVSARITASTSFGNISSDFPVTVEKSSFNSRKVSAELAGGKHQIELDTRNGSINIEKR